MAYDSKLDERGPGSNTGHGGSQHFTRYDANLSFFSDSPSESGVDPDTGAVGTPRQLAEKRMAEGRPLDSLFNKYGKK